MCRLKISLLIIAQYKLIIITIIKNMLNIDMIDKVRELNCPKSCYRNNRINE